MKQVRQIRVWDLPVRVFHWMLVFIMLSAWVTADLLSDFDVHAKIGLFALGLVVFRVSWGFWGSSTARFSTFVRGQSEVKSYLHGEWQGVGHNPLGGWSVLLMLGSVLLLAITGVFANNDGDFTGPLAFLVSTDISNLLTSIHELGFNVLMLLVILHVAAIMFYKHILGTDLIRPMITGDARATDEQDQSTQGGSVFGFILAVLIAAGLVWLVSGAWHSPAATTAVSSPDW